MPVGKVVKYGVWEEDKFIGAICYAWGASPKLGKRYDLEMTQCVELVRVALRSHQAPVSQIVSYSLRLLKKDNPNLRLIVSFADPYRNHAGTIYQAGNWIYTGTSNAISHWIMPDGTVLHSRAYNGRQFGSGARATLPTEAKKILMPPKHRYIYPLDKQMRRRVESLGLPYPHAVEGSEESHIASGDEGKVRSLPTARK